jgi:hypothetical protein
MFPVDVFQSTLSKLTKILRSHEIRFHLTGGLTGAAYGEPRMTQDIDVVIDPTQAKAKLEALVESFEVSDFMFSEESMRRAVATGDVFQLLDELETLKLDIYPREMIPGELDRSQQLEIFEGQFLPVVSRIDAAASKLVWISKGSHKSRRDLRAIFRNANEAEQDEIRKLVEQLKLTELLAEVLNEADEIE